MTNNENVTVMVVAMATTSIERPHHQIETRLSTPVAVPEPLPDWERAKEVGGGNAVREGGRAIHLNKE
jgi:hypothetical protein